MSPFCMPGGGVEVRYGGAGQPGSGNGASGGRLAVAVRQLQGDLDLLDGG